MTRLTARASTILIATGDRTQVFHSVEDVPPHLRKRLQECTSSPQAATILIADRKGREELVRALQGLPSEVQSRLADSLQSRKQRTSSPSPVPAATQQAGRVRREPPPERSALRFWLELLVPLAAGASLWLLTTPHL